MAPDPRLCVFCTRTHRFIDVAADRVAAETALTRFMPEYGPDLVVLGLDDAIARHDAGYRTEPVEVTAQTWDEMLGVLPPVAWLHTGDGESFKISERLSGVITAIYVSIGQRYFTFNDDIRLPHRQCCQRVLASAAYAAPKLLEPAPDKAL